MPHAYVSVDVLKSTGAANVTSTAYDTRILNLIEAVSQEIDNYCNRTFQTYIGTQYFSGDASQLLIVPDLISVSSLKEDGNNNGTFGTTWAATDYNLRPYNANPTATSLPGKQMPYTSIEVNTKSNGSKSVFASGQRNYEIVGTWGYTRNIQSTPATISGGHSSAVVNITMGFYGTAGTISGLLHLGNTILIGSSEEMVYLDSWAPLGATGSPSANRPASGTTMQVVRGVNGGTNASAGGGTSLSVFTYPQAITDAALIQSMRLWKRREASFASQIGFQDVGIVQTFRGLDQDVKLFLNPFKKLSIG